jgi:hypothetical protein
MSSKGGPLSAEVQSLVLDRLHQLHPEVADWRQERKEVGRHAGSVFVAGDLRYFVKQQTLCIRTLYVYHLLAALGRGPQSFFALAYRRPGGESGKEEAFDHIIATRDVPDFRMASDDDEAKRTLHLLTVEDAMCLILLVCCFGLGDIPANTDNWGTTTSGRLALVDFSFGRFPMPPLGLGSFFDACRPYIAAGHNERDASAAKASFLHVYSQWFGTTESFAGLLDGAMDQVIAWVNDDTHQREWRQAQSIQRSFHLLEKLTRFQHIASKQFEHFMAL